MNRESMRTRARLVEVVLVVSGAYSVFLGLFMLVAPGEFWATLGAFGPRNDHYIFDNASFELPLGLLLLAALRWRSWRVPALSFATAHWALHALSHLVDTNHADGQACRLARIRRPGIRHRRARARLRGGVVGSAACRAGQWLTVGALQQTDDRARH